MGRTSGPVGIAVGDSLANHIWTIGHLTTRLNPGSAKLSPDVAPDARWNATLFVDTHHVGSGGVSDLELVRAQVAESRVMTSGGSIPVDETALLPKK